MLIRHRPRAKNVNALLHGEARESTEVRMRGEDEDDDDDDVRARSQGFKKKIFSF